VKIDFLTGVALITLLFMMLQTEHERCDKVREGWRAVCSAIYTTIFAIQLAQQRKGTTEAQKYLDAAYASARELYSTVLLHGKGSLRNEYLRVIDEGMKTRNIVNLLPLFGECAERLDKKFDRWTLRVL
jgi:hypothetical protein